MIETIEFEKGTPEEIKNKLKDEKIFVSFFCGEFGWGIQEFFGHLRFLKKEKYPDYKFILFMDMSVSCLVSDFAYLMLPLPEFVYSDRFDRDCYELVEKGSPAGSLTPPDIYSDIIEYIRQFYDYTSENTVEFFTPRGCNHIIDNMPQIFSMYKSDLQIVNFNKPIICIFPRNRERASNRNVPVYVWKEVVDRLKEDFLIVLGGTPNGACLADYPESNDVINLISYNGEDKLEKIIAYLNNSVCSISSQSFLTSVSMLSGCNSYIIGHERERHISHYNRGNVPCSFRYVTDYRAIDADTIMSDIAAFLYELEKAGCFNERPIPDTINRPSLRTLRDKKDLIGIEIGVSDGANALNILENLDIKKLYLVDSYVDYAHFKNVIEWKKEAYQKLEKYKDRIIWIEKTSDDAIKDIQEQVDFCYIDGGHDFNSVNSDTINYYPIVKDGGLISWHDAELFGVYKVITNNIQEVIYKDVCQDCKPLEAWCFKGYTTKKVSDNILLEDNQILKELM
jgi:hypothetical protein